MRPVLRIKTKILPGNKIEIDAPELSVGEAVEVFILLQESHSHAQHSAIDLLEEIPGQRSLKTSEEVDQYIREERDSWER